MGNKCEGYSHGGDSVQCEDYFDCCDCGGNECGCAYCFSCNACDFCLNDRD